MPDNKIIRTGSTVEMHFRLSLENGFVVEDTHDDEPFVFVLGDGSVVSGLQEALDGMKEHVKESIRLSPEQAYGFSDPQNVMSMPLAEFPEEMSVKKGLVVGFTSPSGEEIPGTVMELTADTVTVNFNHPLADQVVIFDVEILSVKNAPLN